MQKSLLKPILKQRQLTVGIFTPSSPAHVGLRDKFMHGVDNLRSLGFKVKLGELTASQSIQHHRTASGQSRAAEFMSLISDENIDIVMANIGGHNTSSLLPYLDYDLIRRSRKLICGYSDVTSLHMAIMTQSGLSTCYGPALTPSFGEWPLPDPTTLHYFRQLLSGGAPYAIEAPPQWSNHFRDYARGRWKEGVKIYTNNPGWRGLKHGRVSAPLVCVNLSTVLAIAGTPYFPDLNGAILLIEDMEVSLSMFERRLMHLKLLGVFEGIKGLIFSKIEFPEKDLAYEAYESVLEEICAAYTFPIVSNFDCGHTVPMISFCQGASVTLEVAQNVSLRLNEAMITTNDSPSI